MREALAEAISRLPEREKLVVTLYYYEELTLREIGEVLGVTESRVSQLHTKAILRLKVAPAGGSSAPAPTGTAVASLAGRYRIRGDTMPPSHVREERGVMSTGAREDPQRRRRRPSRDRQDLARRGDAVPGRARSTGSAASRRARPSPTGTRTRSKRQMSLAASLAHLEWQGRKINLIDTPGDSGFQADTIASAARRRGRARRRLAA